MNLKKITVLFLICISTFDAFAGTRHVEIGGSSRPKEAYDLYFDCIKNQSENLTAEEAEEICRHILEGSIGGFFEEGLKRSIDNSISNLNNFAKDKNYNLIPATATATATAGITIWVLMRTPMFYRNFLLKKANPEFMIIPPEILDSLFANNQNNISISNFKRYGLNDLKKFLDLTSAQQYDFLIKNRDFLAFLLMTNRSVEEQQFLILYYKGQAA